MGMERMGQVAGEMEARLKAALAPTRLELVNDSAKHRGHMGDDGSGESHFSLLIEAAAFAGMSRVARQRAVYAALGDIMESRVHALAIRALAPGEAA
jgi:BolA protein